MPHVRFDMRPTRETLADVARRSTRPGPSTSPQGMGFQSLEKAYEAAERSANKLADKVGPNAMGLAIYKAIAPRWADYGPKMWKLASENPRHPDAYEALLWIIGHPIFFDAREERAAIVGMAVDALIRDHLDAIAADLAARNVAKAFNMGAPMPGPHVDRLYRALYERSKSREARGRMGLNLARLPQGRGRAGRESRRPRDRPQSPVSSWRSGPELHRAAPQCATPARSAARPRRSSSGSRPSMAT